MTQTPPHQTVEIGWQLNDITLRRAQTPVFTALTLQLHETRIGLIGRNGAGKSSLLRLLCALEMPYNGTLLWRGQPVHDRLRGSAPRVGLMFQNPDDQIICPTVEEELQLSWQGAHGGDRKTARQAAQAFLAEQGLAHWGGRAVGSLSHGQRQWLCWLAMRLAAPEVMLLDEPFASLDLPGQLRLSEAIATCGERQVIVSTHVLDPIRDFTRVLWLEQGQVRADGSGHEVCAAYEAFVHTQRR